jgi:hypothetical protein
VEGTGGDEETRRREVEESRRRGDEETRIREDEKTRRRGDEGGILNFEFWILN